jgi:ketosteroid isomerase-like protein
MTNDGERPDADMPPTAADDVGAAHARWWEALLAGDAATLDELLADDLTFHSPYGTAESKQGFLGNLRAGRLGYDAIEDAGPSTRLHGEAAIVTGSVDIRFRWEGDPRLERLYYTAVYGWTAPRWHMLAWQSTQRADAQG